MKTEWMLFGEVFGDIEVFSVCRINDGIRECIAGIWFDDDLAQAYADHLNEKERS